jgi:RNA polymerase sigma factor (sigma-70 family)
MSTDQDFEALLTDCLGGLASGDKQARARILEICDARLRQLSRRLLGRFAKVRRWDDTDDVAQNAAIRLYRALESTKPSSPKGLMSLMATQIQRELIDLARKHSGPMAYGANHGTNAYLLGDRHILLVDETPDQSAADDNEIPLERWESFHAAVNALPEDQREVFRLAWYLGLDQAAIARTTGQSLRTVARRWQEARAAVATTVERDE